MLYRHRSNTTRRNPASWAGVGTAALFVLFSAACDDATDPSAVAGVDAATETADFQTPYTGFASLSYDLAATPDGAILVGDFTSVKEIRGETIETIATLNTSSGPVYGPATINGLEATNRGNYFVATGGPDQAIGAGVWHVSRGRATLVGDIETFENTVDPDVNAPGAWKDPACEFLPGQFSPGPQSNPYHLAALSGSEVLLGDAAGNSLLKVKKNGDVDWVAVFPPASDGDPADSGNWLVLFPLSAETDCYVQPVPTAVDVGPDGAYYVGELTGATPGSVPATGWSRVWRIEPGSENVTCPSAECQVALDGFTSIIDVTFGPDGDLYVVEFDENGWLAATGGDLGLGTVNRCDLSAGSCSVVAAGLVLPAAIDFDKRGNLWLLENPFDPTVRILD